MVISMIVVGCFIYKSHATKIAFITIVVVVVVDLIHCCTLILLVYHNPYINTHYKLTSLILLLTMYIFHNLYNQFLINLNKKLNEL